MYEEKCIGENAGQNLIAAHPHPAQPHPPSVTCRPPAVPMLSSPSGAPPPLPAKTIGRRAMCGGGGVGLGGVGGGQRMS